MNQKFGKFTFVKVDDEMPSSMSHFESGFIGVVDGTFSQIYGGKDIKEYALYKIEEGKIVNRISWYKEDQLTATEYQDKNKAEEMLEEYNFRISD